MKGTPKPPALPLYDVLSMGRAPGTMVLDTTPAHRTEPPHATAIRYHPRATPARPRRRPQPPGHRRRLPGRRPSLARRRPRPGHHRLPVPAPGPPRQHRLPARRPLRRLDLHRQRLLPGPQAAAPGRLPAAPGGDRRARCGRPPTGRTAGAATGSGSSTARASRCPTSPSCGGTSASPPASARGAASPWPSGWRSSTSPPGCSCASAPAPLRTHEMCQLAADLRGAGRRATSCWATAASARMPTWPCWCGAGCTACSASTSGRSSTSRPGAATCRPGGRPTREDLPRSRWVPAPGERGSGGRLVQAEAAGRRG